MSVCEYMHECDYVWVSVIVCCASVCVSREWLYVRVCDGVCVSVWLCVCVYECVPLVLLAVASC